MSRRSTLVLMVASIVLAASGTARAECIASWKTAADFLGGEALIFVGTVTEIGPDDITTTFDVQTAWQGDVHSRMTIAFMPGLEAWNFFDFKVGETYLVVAYPTSRKTESGLQLFEASSCSPTARLSQAGESIAQLGRVKTPQAVRP
jgi:hypothetical protein